MDEKIRKSPGGMPGLLALARYKNQADCSKSLKKKIKMSDIIK